jgi:uncharacterized membrane protein YcaP (DUF421 family)
MDVNQYLNIVIRSVIALIALFILTKLLGKKQISQLSVFEYVIGISMGSIAAEISVNEDTPTINGVIAMVVYTFIVYIMSFFTLKSLIFRRLFTGTPTILVQNGQILAKGLKKSMLDVNDLLEECRCNGYFDLNKIEYAIMETNGQISFLPKSEERPLTPKDMNIKLLSEDLVANIVIDGKIIINNLKIINKNKKWLLSKLKKRGYNNLQNILLVTCDINKKLVIYEKNENIKEKSCLE